MCSANWPVAPSDPQVIYDGPPDGLPKAEDARVRQFVEGDARDRLQEREAG